ncbi:hypothetical protein BS47DRAFT_1351065 [Hydnum rufescens UP504]|uniref:Uncharacterized protein n=1 Tax=Hydnum rufescens UP504 TaxID=1448309 RepID=A0A9P6ALR8_9AGAM|nr:hypothetical protein BS47DRAFT_1351065 [Hydnum rufescens UP504]
MKPSSISKRKSVETRTYLKPLKQVSTVSVQLMPIFFYLLVRAVFGLYPRFTLATAYWDSAKNFMAHRIHWPTKFRVRGGA